MTFRLADYHRRPYLSDEGFRNHRTRDLWPNFHQRNSLSVHRTPLFTFHRLIIHFMSDPAKKARNKFNSSAILENITRLVHLFPQLQHLRVVLCMDLKGEQFDTPAALGGILKLARFSFTSIISIGCRDIFKFIWYKRSAYFKPQLPTFLMLLAWESYAGGLWTTRPGDMATVKRMVEDIQDGLSLKVLNSASSSQHGTYSLYSTK